MKLASEGFATSSQIRERLTFSSEETRALRALLRAFPMRWSRYYLSLIDPDDPDNPIRRMGRPDLRESHPSSSDLSDPVGDMARRPIPFVVQKYPDRVILLVTSRCHFYCRFCFRREEGVGSHREPTEADLDRALDWISDQARVEEVILSGGDPLTLDDGALERLAVGIKDRDGIRCWRIHSRAPVHFPERITGSLLEALGRGPAKPLRFVVHYNHPAELTPESLDAIRRIQDHGYEVLNQTVLLAAINDDAETLATLMDQLVQYGIVPYYLHHPDHAPGNNHFRVSIDRGMQIYRALQERIGSERIPAYVVDLPDGRGKVPVLTLVPLTPVPVQSLSSPQSVPAGLYEHQWPDGSRSRVSD